MKSIICQNHYLINKLIFSSITLLLSFTLNGQTVEWVKGTGGELGDGGAMIQVDSQGNVFVSGGFTGFVSFDPNSNDYDFTSSTYGDIFLQKFDTDGNFLWAKVFVTNEPQYPMIEIDNNDNIYISTEFQGSIDLDPGPGEDIHTCPPGNINSFIAKLDNEGNYLWGKDFQISGIDKYAIIQSMCKDKNNNMILSGVFHGSIDFDFGVDEYNVPGPYNHGFFLKIDEDGNFQWVKTIGGIFNYFEFVKTVIDNSNSIIIGGSFAGPSIDFDPGNNEEILATPNVNNHDIFILKLDEFGNFEWVKKAEGHYFDLVPWEGWGGDDTILSLAVDKNNNIYFTGGFCNSINFEPDTSDFILDLELEPCTEVPCEIYPTSFIAKMTGNGNMVWAKKFEGENKLYYLSSNNKSTTNLVWTNNNNEVYFGLNPYGTIEVEVDNISFTYTSDKRFITFLNVDPNNGLPMNVFFMGNNFHTTLNDIKVISNKVYATGGFIGELFFDSQHSLYTNEIYADAYTLKMTDNTLGVSQQDQSNVSVYPNPVSDSFNINTETKQILSVSVFDVQGRFLKTYNTPNTNNGYNVTNLSNGLYIINITFIDGSIFTHKIIKI